MKVSLSLRIAKLYKYSFSLSLSPLSFYFYFLLFLSSFLLGHGWFEPCFCVFIPVFPSSRPCRTAQTYSGVPLTTHLCKISCQPIQIETLSFFFSSSHFWVSLIHGAPFHFHLCLSVALSVCCLVCLSLRVCSLDTTYSACLSTHLNALPLLLVFCVY